ncbi:MAG: translation initiation factor IF-3 [Chloroflexi bacterium]|nr:translation initiation factor IF-3 [Chloroflexota bacterium]
MGKISSKSQRINEQIRVPQVRVITQDGRQVGVLPTREALRLAEEQGVDMVEVAPNADPPVVRLMDYGKFVYERSKKEREARKSQKVTEVKEIHFRPKTGEHDLGYKVKRARQFLESGAKVKVRIRFRGREVTHPEVGLDILRWVADELGDLATVEQAPQPDGRSLLMILSPQGHKER